MKKLSVFIGSLALALFIGASSANATIISPPVIELEANRGDQLANTVKIKNDGESTETYYLTVDAFTAVGEEGQPTFSGAGDEAVNWVDFSFEQLTLQPGQATTIPFSVSVPDTARSGGHYVAVFASTTPPEVEGSGVGISARIGSLLLIRVEGETVENARIKEFSTTRDSYNMLPIDFTVRVENNGNVHVKPVGEIVVRGMFGNEATRLKVNEDGGNILPNSVRRFDVAWGDEEPTGFFERYAKQKNDKLFGKYTAELTVIYADGKVAKDEIQFWVLPWERIIVDLILLVVIVIIIVLLVKKYNSYIIAQAMEKSKKSKK